MSTWLFPQLLPSRPRSPCSAVFVKSLLRDGDRQVPPSGDGPLVTSIPLELQSASQVCLWAFPQKTEIKVSQDRFYFSFPLKVRVSVSDEADLQDSIL